MPEEKNWSVHGGPNLATIIIIYRCDRKMVLDHGSTVDIMLAPEAALQMAAQLIQAVMEAKL